MRFSRMAVVGAALFGLGCSSQEPVAPPEPARPLPAPPVPCSDTVESVYGDPGPLNADPGARGNLVRCASEPTITREQIQETLGRFGYTGRPISSGARVFRVSYQTLRGNDGASPTVSSSIAYVPEVPAANGLPLVVLTGGARGQAAACATSRIDQSLADINDNFYRLAYGLVGLGYAVLAPDLAGFAHFNAPLNPPSAFTHSRDAARSTLDGAKALKKLVPELSDKIVLVGHSQGGHNALSALAHAEEEGFDITAVALYAPLWISSRSWGAVLWRDAAEDNAVLTKSYAPSVSVWYHYTHAELLDGPGEGEKLFPVEKRQAIRNFVETQCWGSKALEPIATYADELFDPEFVKSVSQPAGTGGTCSTPLCQKWIDRYSQGRPHLTGKAATTPILIMYGTEDTVVTAPRMRCGLDRLIADNANFTFCASDAIGHGDIVPARTEAVVDWIGSMTLGRPAPSLPGRCAKDRTPLAAVCPALPPND